MFLTLFKLEFRHEEEDERVDIREHISHIVQPATDHIDIATSKNNRPILIANVTVLDAISTDVTENG